MSWLDDFIDAIEEITITAWPETSGNAMRGKTSAKINWREAIINAQGSLKGIGLEFPMAVVENSDFRPETVYGDANDAYTTRLTFLYINTWEDIEGGGGEEADPAVAEKLLAEKFEAIRLAFKADFDSFSVVAPVTKNDSITSPTNQFLLKNQFPAYALEVYVDVLLVVSDE